MDEFDESRGLDVRLRPVSAGAAGQHDQQRAQPLAAPGNDVLGDLVHQRDGALQPGADHLIDGAEVRLDERADFFQCHERTDLEYGHASYPTRGPPRMDPGYGSALNRSEAGEIAAVSLREASV